MRMLIVENESKFKKSNFINNLSILRFPSYEEEKEMR